GLQITTEGSTLHILKSDAAPLPINTTNTLTLVYTDSVSGAHTNRISFKSVLLYENFDELALGESAEEAVGTPDVWTPTPPVGWTTNNAGVPGIGDPSTDGVT